MPSLFETDQTVSDKNEKATGLCQNWTSQLGQILGRKIVYTSD